MDTPIVRLNFLSLAETMRQNPAFSAEVAITELGVGEALISCLDAKGSPSVVERQARIKSSLLYGHYEKTVDRESAYERLQARAGAVTPTLTSGAEAPAAAGTGAGGRRNRSAALWRNPPCARSARRSGARSCEGY